MRRYVLIGGLMVASLAALFGGAAAHSAADPGLDSQNYLYRILADPRSGDELGFRPALQGAAQTMSDKLFAQVSQLLGGTAPTLNFVPVGSQFLSDGNASASLTDLPGSPKGSVNMSPLATEALINPTSVYHDSAVTTMPHEMAHLRQTTPTLADVMQREGGAQAFADLVTPTAAKRAGIPYTPGNYDGDYAPYVQSVQQAPYGRSWILGGQFGKTAPPTWP